MLPSEACNHLTLIFQGNSLETKTLALLRSPLAALAPPLVLVFCVWLWAIDVLNWDEWMIWTNVVESLQRGGLSLTDLVVQQNEQRNLAARLSGLLLLPVFGLNRIAECVLNIALAGGILLLVRRLYSQTALPSSAPPPMLAFSLLCFSLLQWETFSVGINSSVLLPPLAMWAGAVLLNHGTLTWGRLMATILVGIIPSFSFVNGLFYWVCLTPLVALRAEGWGRIPKLGFFLLVASLVWTTYFHGYTRPPHHPSPFLAFTHPLALGGYFLAYLGGALVGDKNLLPLGILAGCASLGLLWLCLNPIFEHWRRRDLQKVDTTLRWLAPWLAVATFSLLSAMATAVGRSGFGLGHALESRYATFSTPLWLVLVALFALYGHMLPEHAKRWGRPTFWVCSAVFLLSSVLSAVVLHNRAPKLAEARAEIFRCTETEKLKAVFPDPAYIVLKLPVFLKLRLAMYRDIKPLEAYTLKDNSFIGHFEIQPGLGVSGRVKGYLAMGQIPTDASGLVLLALPDTVAAVAKTDSQGRFNFFLPDAALPAGVCMLRALALDEDGQTLRPIGSVAGLPLINSPSAPPALQLEKYFHVR